MRNVSFPSAFLLALLLRASGAHSQQPQPQEAQTSVNLEPAAEPTEPSAHTAPVFWVTSVEVLRSTHEPQLDVVRVRGVVPTKGWEKAELVPLTKGVPVDGVLDLALVAEAPINSTTPVAYETVEAVFALEPGHPFHGVRVHGAGNRISLSSLPGYQEAQKPPASCADCVGKYLTRKGERPAANYKAAEVLREEDLPHNLRVIRESDGIGSLEQDPNRLTLLLNASGQVVSAFWD